MVIINGFNRKEASKLTGLTARQINYLESKGLITSYRVAEHHNSAALYSWQQLLEIKAIARLRESVSLQTVRKVVDFLEENFDDSKIYDKPLIIFGSEVFWFDASEDLRGKMIAISGKNKGQVTSHIFYMGEFRDEIFHNAEETKVIPLDELRKRANIAEVA